MSEAIAYAGEPGAFAEDALLAYFGAAAPSLSVTSFGDVRAAVLDGRAISGVLPIENLINGTVRETLDLLRDGALEIVGEVVVPVSLVLAALPGVTLEQVERVYSHAQALAQAEEYLRSRPWALLTTYNTAGAGAMIRERGERDAAAVLSPRAAAIHGLERVLHHIEERLLNLVTVSENEGEFTRDIKRDAHAKLLHLLAQEASGFRNDGDEIGVGEVRRSLADGSEEIADNTVQSVDLALTHLGSLPDLGCGG